MSGPGPFRCSAAALSRGDTLRGTASPALGFLLIEVSGPWGRQALTQSRLDPHIGRTMSARAVAAGMRALVIRRVGRQDDVRRRHVAVVDARPGQESVRWEEFTHDRELLGLSLDAHVSRASSEPVYLVCTHSKHDVCCAMRGRPVAAAFAALRPQQTWECSHVGGDRFAGNVVVLPHGLYYGQVTAERAEEVVAAHEQGRVLPDLLRGRSRWLPAAQAAQDFVRGHYAEAVDVADDTEPEADVLAIGAFEPAGTLPLADGRWQVRLAHPRGYVVVTVEATVRGEAGLLTCHARRPAHSPAFEVTDLVEVLRPSG